jgi:hypothetical protein
MKRESKSLAEHQEIADLMSSHVVLCYNMSNANISKKNYYTNCSTSASLHWKTELASMGASVFKNKACCPTGFHISDALGLRCFGS